MPVNSAVVNTTNGSALGSVDDIQTVKRSNDRAIFSGRVGNSAGGYVAQNLAMSAPERVQSLMLFGSTPGLKNSRSQATMFSRTLSGKGS